MTALVAVTRPGTPPRLVIDESKFVRAHEDSTWRTFCEAADRYLAMSLKQNESTG